MEYKNENIRFPQKNFGSFNNYVYLCSVRMKVLAIRVESRVG